LQMLPPGRIVHLGEAGHAVAVYRRDDSYHFYDSNHPEGLAVKTASPQQVASMITESYKYFKWFGGYLKVDVFSNPAAESKMTDSARIKLIEFMRNCDTNRNDSLLQCAARSVSEMNLDTLRAITQTQSNPEKLIDIINREKVLAIAYDCKNVNFIKSILALENVIDAKNQILNKNELLVQAFEDYVSPSLFGSYMNASKLEDLIKSLVMHGADVRLLEKEKKLPSWLKEVITLPASKIAENQDKSSLPRPGSK